MMGIEFHRPADQRAATVPIADEGDEEHGLVAAVERVERQRSFAGGEARGHFLSKEVRARQRLVREVIGRRDVDRTPRGGQRSIERPGPGVESVAVLVRIHPRQHRPAIRIRRRLLDRALERGARLRMFVRRQTMVVAEAAHQRFVRREQAGVLARTASLMLRASTPNISAHVETMRGMRSSCSAKI